jgi:uncharacterized protein (DUF1697 family)
MVAPMSARASTNRYVALLRGINVGSAKQLAMADLKALLEDLGHTEVKTYLRSGQAVFTTASAGTGSTKKSTKTSGKTSTTTLAADIEAAITETLDMDVPVVVRSRAEMAKVIDANPFLRPAGGTGQPDRDPARLFCVFLSAKLTAADLSGVDAAAYEPEEFALGSGGREIFLWLPDGMGVSKLGVVKWDRVSGKRQLVATARNWRTTLTLLELRDG